MKTLVILITAFCSVFLSSCLNVTRLSGRIGEDRVLSGNIILEGDLYIEPKITLTVLQGTKIRYSDKEIKTDIQRLRNFDGNTYDLFDGKKIEIIIAGDLNISGSMDDPVEIIAPKKDPSIAGGISFIGLKSTSTLEYLNIYGGHIGIRVYDSRAPVIKNVSIEKNNAGAIGCWDRSAPIIIDSVVSNNKYGIGASDISKPIISRCRVLNNSASGLFFEGMSTGYVSDVNSKGNNVGIALGDKGKAEIIKSTFTGNGCGIGCWDSSESVIKGNTFLSNISGILALNESNISVSGNFFRENGSALTITDKSSGEISNNSISESGPGIISSGNTSPLIRKNIIKSGRYGVLVEKSSKPNIRNNRFEENRVGIIYTDYAAPRISNNIFNNNLNDTIDNRLTGN